MRERNLERKAVYMRLRIDLYDMLRKLAVDLGVTSTDVITQYLEFLQKSQYKHRLVLNENTEKTNFQLIGRNPGPVHGTDFSNSQCPHGDCV